MQSPVIYLAFANDQDAHLPLLKEESRQLMKALHTLHDQQIIEVYREESTNIQDLISTFNRFDGRLAVFHFGGHAGGKGLHLDEGQALAQGLAALISQQKHLQIVFLNGCSTLAQVDRLMTLGVKAVIATSVPIQDAMAKNFSEWFYQALANHRTIQSAFEFAVAALQTSSASGEAPAILEYRGIKIGRSEEILPWGLYINEDQKEVLQWQLPKATAVQKEHGLRQEALGVLEQQGLRRQAELLLKKINRTREALAIEDDPGRQIRYETQLEQWNTELSNLKQRAGL